MNTLSLDQQLKRLGWSHVPVPADDKFRSGRHAVYNETRTFVGFYDAFELWVLLRASGRIGIVVAP
jgi:hypothetical protein